MKTAISIPNATFKEADELANRLGISRSALYTKAVEAFLRKYRGEQIVNALNEIYSQEGSELEIGLQQLQDLTLVAEEW